MDPLIFSILVMLAVVLLFMLPSAAVAVYAERRVSAFIQNRYGPNRVGPLGLFQPFADVIKLFFKEDIIPDKANRALYILAPMIPVATAIVTVAVIPFSEFVYITDLNIGVLFLLAVASLSVYGVTLAGWASNSKYSLLGGLRSAAQMISYELPMGVALASVILFAGSLSVVDIVGSQETWWNVFRNPIACIIFIVAAFAEANRTPFDLVEAEQELVGGFHTEYSSMKFGTFFLAEYMHVVIASMLITTFFFGGYHLPFAGYWLPEMGVIAKSVLDISVFLAKTTFWAFVFIWIRWTLPRFKFNQLMRIGWSRLLPLGIINFIVIAIILYYLG
ncbi:NADH-quinone oxidoreductase subunit NuoH [Balneolaceae bacterium ANBcel3]|nr:NADH-quinone oxidoreductase subunit NuoH [Balneolaceae bacterium ANBcel3]